MTPTIAQLKRAIIIREQIAKLEKELGTIFNGNAKSAPAKKTRRKMSAAARKKISIAAKARWAKIRAGKKK